MYDQAPIDVAAAHVQARLQSGGAERYTGSDGRLARRAAASGAKLLVPAYGAWS